MASRTDDKMEVLLLSRNETSDEGTFGTLTRLVRNKPLKIAETCELPWKENMSKISCIPKGTYFVTRYKSPSKGDVFLLYAVPGRSMIEIHVGNTILDIEGCILVGNARGEVKGRPAVTGSRDTMKKLLADLPKEFYLQVAGVCG